MNQEYYQQRKYLPRLLALLAVLSWVVILSSYLTTVFMAGAVACLMLPVYRWLRMRMGKVSAVLVFVLLLLSCILLPLIVVSVMLVPQAVIGFRSLNEWRLSGWEISPQLTDSYNSLMDWLMRVPGLSNTIEEFTANLNTFINDLVRNVLSGSIGVAGSTLNAILLIFLFLILTTLAVVYAPTLRKLFITLTDLPEQAAARFLRSMHSALRAVLVGILLVAVFQGVMCGIGYWLVGVSQPTFWGMVTAFAAIVPFLGTSLVWLPMSVILWLQGEHLSAIALIAWGGILVSNIDNLIRPYLLQTGIDAPIFVLLLSIFCALAVFGWTGLILGPLLVAFALWAMHESEIALAAQQGRNLPK